MTGMILLGHETKEAAQESAIELRSLGANARRLLEECIAESGVHRKNLSNAARALESAGFIFVRDIGSQWDGEFELIPSLAGEEAMEIIWLSEESVEIPDV